MSCFSPWSGRSTGWMKGDPGISTLAVSASAAIALSLKALSRQHHL
ncbi:MAG: hypothetical protein ABFD46_07865 [Armatimonadota bacterium]